MMRNLRFLSHDNLGRRVMLLLDAALLSSLILFSLSVFYFVYHTESDAWRERQAEAARSAAGSISGYIQRVEDSLVVLSAFDPHHLVENSSELQAMLTQNPALLEVLRADSQGLILADAVRGENLPGALSAVAQSQWFLQARAGKTYVGDLQFSKINEPYLTLATSAPDGGVAAALVKMDILREVVQDIHLGKGGQGYVIDRSGRILAHTDPGVLAGSLSIQGRPEFAALMAASNNEWFGTFTNIERERVMGSARPIEGTNWLVVTELPLAEVFLATRTAFYILGSVALLLLVSVTLLVGRLVRLLIVNPMDQLKRGAENLGQGRFDYRIGLNRKDEIGQLALAFDRMAAQIQDREARLAEQTRATQASEARYRAIVEDQTDLICRFLPDGTLTFVNEAYCRYFGKPRDELLGRAFNPPILDEDRLHVSTQLALLSRQNPVVTYEHRSILPDGSLHWQQWTDRAMYNSDGQVAEYASVGMDITERKLAQSALQTSEANLRRLNQELEERVRERTSALRESEERYMLAVRGANDGLWDWNLRKNEIYFSPRWKSMLGFDESGIGNKPEEWLRRIHSKDLAGFRTALSDHLSGASDHFESEYRILDADRQYRWMLCRGLAVRDANGKAYRMAGSQTDITDRKMVEERLAHDALHDALTGLPNRTLFVDRLTQRLERAKRHKDDLFAILFLDMDRFKVINDSLGHAMGDKLLVTTAQRLRSCLRPEDTVSRFGGDEFAILLGEISDVSDAIRVVERIQSRMHGTTILGSIQRSSSASIGITVFKGNYTDPQEMLRDADSAMYRAKAQGGGRYQVFDVRMYQSAMALLQMETDLKRAVERQEWLIHYQPVVLVESRRIAGVEALVRWRHPERGLIAPGEFIPVAEESGLIIPIGEYVLREACRQAKAWRDAGINELWVSVNLSGRQFQDESLVQKVQQVLQATGLPGDGLRLEVTETVAMQDFEYSVRILKELADLGIHLSLDDFGNGYSSLGYLKRFPIRSLKIDRSFIRDIDMNRNSEAIASAIITLGHSLNLEVVAEGVETKEQLAFLKSQVCDEIQGFLFSKPGPANEIDKLIQRRRPLLPGATNILRE